MNKRAVSEINAGFSTLEAQLRRAGQAEGRCRECSWKCGVGGGGDAPGESTKTSKKAVRFKERACRVKGRGRKCTRRSAGEWACRIWRGGIRFGCQLEVCGRTRWSWIREPTARWNTSCLRGVGPEPYPWRTSLTRTRRCHRLRRTSHWRVWRTHVRTRTPLYILLHLREYP